MTVLSDVQAGAIPVHFGSPPPLIVTVFLELAAALEVTLTGTFIVTNPLGMPANN